MSDLMRMTGMYSGMDTESIIAQLVSAKSKKVTDLKNDQKKLEWKQTAWQDLNSKIYNLYSKTLSNMRFTSAYKKKKTSSSDPTKANVLAGDGAVDGTQSLEVLEVAKAGYLTGAKLDSTKTEYVKDADGKVIRDENGQLKTRTVPWSAADKLSEINKDLVGKKITINVGTGDDAKKTEIEITADMTIGQFTKELGKAGVNANFDETNQRFFVVAAGTGKDKDFTISASGSDTLKALGLDASATYANGSECTKDAANDAKIKLNGATFESGSNAFNINGLTINVTGKTTDGPVTIVTETDYDGVYDTIKDFISEYNELIIEMDKLYNADSARKYSMLTEDEKNAMTDDEVEKWEGTIKGALLRKDSTLSSVMSSMVNAMMKGYEIEVNGEKKTKYLYDYGIKTLSYFDAKDNEHHAYHIDGNTDDESTGTKEDKLKAALASNPEETAEFFATLCKELYTTINDAMNTDKRYSSVYKVYNDKQMKTEYDSYSKKIKKAEKELSDYEDKWYKKFSAMEVALSKLQSNTNAVTSMLGM